jgi:hypothetical protein
MQAVLREHLRLTGGSAQDELARLAPELASMKESNLAILERYGRNSSHFPGKDELCRWFAASGWVVTDGPTATYAGQNWLVRAIRQEQV